MQLFGTGIMYAEAIQDSTGAAVANATPVQFGTLQDISLDISFEQKLLYGSKKFPIAAGQGKGKIDMKAKSADIFGQVFSDLMFGSQASAGIKAIVPNFATSVPASSPYTLTVAPPSSGTFVSDKGVLGANGLPLTKVGSAPTTGQYAVSALGVYTFASADSGNAVRISYEYSATSTSQKIISLTNQAMGQAPFFKMAMTTSYGGKNFTVNFVRCMATKLALPFKNDDFSVTDLDITAMADSTDSIGYIAMTE